MFDFTIWTWVTSPSYCHQIAGRMTFSVFPSLSRPLRSFSTFTAPSHEIKWHGAAHISSPHVRIWTEVVRISPILVPTQPEHSPNKTAFAAFADWCWPFGGQRRPDPCCLWAGWIGMCLKLRYNDHIANIEPFPTHDSPLELGTCNFQTTNFVFTWYMYGKYA
jgi:hypothetical protein